MDNALPLSSQPPARQLGFKILSTALLWVVYALGFMLLAPYVKEPTGILMLIPVAMSSWFWGMRVGAALALLGGLLNFGLYVPTDLLAGRPWLIIIPNLVILGVGTLVGYLQDLRQTLKQQNVLIQYHADHDALTGLRNRASFSREMTRLLETASVEDSLLGLLYIDLDGFKRVNDTLGHAAGDALLVAVAKRLCNVTRSSDLHARLGGDEFAVALPKLKKAEDAETAGTKVLNALSEPYRLEGDAVKVLASIGISVFPESGKTLEDLLHLADKAMYAVKAQGKSGVCVSGQPEKTSVSVRAVTRNAKPLGH